LARNKYTSDRIDEEIFSGEESYLVDENLLEDTLDIESLSLESILAEYKGSAYIDGDRKTPPDILDEKTKRIILEETGRLEKTRSAEPTPELEQTAFAQEGTAVKISQPDTTADSGVIPLHSIRNDYIDSDLWGDGTRPYTGTVTEETLYSAGAFEDEYEPEEPEKKRRRGLFGRLRGGYEVETAALEYDDEDEYDDYAYYEDEFEDEEIEVPVLEEEIFEEPDFKVATRRFAALCNAYSVRFFFSFLVSAVMVIVTLVYNGKNPLDERSTFIATGILLILLLLSMIIGIDQMIYGIVRLFRKQAGYETLNFFA
jgi:hypothetical protein